MTWSTLRVIVRDPSNCLIVIYTSVITVRTYLIIQLGPELKEPRAVVIYGSLFKYTQQFTAGFTENSWTPRTS